MQKVAPQLKRRGGVVVIFEDRFGDLRILDLVVPLNGQIKVGKEVIVIFGLRENDGTMLRRLRIWDRTLVRRELMRD